MFKGHATQAGTRKYASRFPQFKYRELSKAQWHVSQVGFGSYRIDPQIHNHHHALQQALAGGVNLIDTSSNYGDGGSEQLIGRILGQAFAGSQIEREQVVIVSKVGYLQGSNYTMSQQRKAESRPWPDLVEHSPNLEHCIHPDFIEDQLTRSLERLGLETIDCYLLHNPEYYLSWAEKRHVPLEIVRNVFYDRIRNAFLHLEKEVSAGRIRSYGVSSNTFVNPTDHTQFTDLTRMWEIAQSISQHHHFQVVQMPINLYEPEGFTLENQQSGESVVSFAASKKMGVLINRPLNAVTGSTLTRLADAPHFEASSIAEVESSLDAVVLLEKEFQQQMMPTLGYSPQIVSQLGQYITAGQMLQGKWHSLGTYHQWEQTVTGYLLPRLNAARNFLSEEGNLPPEGLRWLNEYVESVNRAFRAIGGIFGGIAQQKEQEVRQKVESAEPAWLANTLSQTAIRALRNTTGVTCVLVGMRKPDYVTDVLADLRHNEPQVPYDKAWKSLSNH